jgi:hypothetical protein
MLGPLAGTTDQVHDQLQQVHDQLQQKQRHLLIIPTSGSYIYIYNAVVITTKMSWKERDFGILLQAGREAAQAA